MSNQRGREYTLSRSGIGGRFLKRIEGADHGDRVSGGAIVDPALRRRQGGSGGGKAGGFTAAGGTARLWRRLLRS